MGWKTVTEFLFDTNDHHYGSAEWVLVWATLILAVVTLLTALVELSKRWRGGRAILAAIFVSPPEIAVVTPQSLSYSTQTATSPALEILNYGDLANDVTATVSVWRPGLRWSATSVVCTLGEMGGRVLKAAPLGQQVHLASTDAREPKDSFPAVSDSVWPVKQRDVIKLAHVAREGIETKTFDERLVHGLVFPALQYTGGRVYLLVALRYADRSGARVSRSAFYVKASRIDGAVEALSFSLVVRKARLATIRHFAAWLALGHTLRAPITVAYQPLTPSTDQESA